MIMLGLAVAPSGMITPTTGWVKPMSAASGLRQHNHLDRR